MVVRRAKKNRKYLGSRRWGVGNIKNARGAGSRGGVGGLARLRKHDWTYFTAKAPELIKKKGFAPWKPKRLGEITLARINEMLKAEPKKNELEFRDTKVLSNGELERPATIRAASFSKAAVEKISAAGGAAIRFAPEKPKLEKQSAVPAPQKK